MSVEVITYLDVPYLSNSSHPRQTVDLYIPQGIQALQVPLLVFVHGGAWRTGDKADFRDLGQWLAARSIAAVAIPEYRLSIGTAQPAIQHPDHIMDVYLAIEFLLQDSTIDDFQNAYNPKEVYLAGHSAGAWITSALALDSHDSKASNLDSRVRPMPMIPAFDASRTIRSNIQAYICIDGIYDLVKLIKLYPNYMSFIAPAFYIKLPPPLQRTSYTEEDLSPLRKVSLENWPLVQSKNRSPPVYVLHSRDDSLLTTSYANEAVNYFKKLGIDVKYDFDTVKGDHDELLHTETFFEYLGNIIKSHN